jgi:hypothetical protein
MQMYDIMDNQTFVGLMAYLLFCVCKFAKWTVEQLNSDEEEMSAEINRR